MSISLAGIQNRAQIRTYESRNIDSGGWLRGMLVQGGAQKSPGSKVQFDNSQRAIVAWAEQNLPKVMGVLGANGREAGWSRERKGVALSALWRCVYTWDTS